MNDYDKTCIKNDVCDMAICDGKDCNHRAENSNGVNAASGEVPKCEAERYQFGNILFQRLYFTMHWYSIKDGIIIDHDQYRHDLEERLRHLA